MKKLIFQLAVGTAAFVLSTGLAMAGEKKLMHCFAFTVIPEATDADWAAFAKATDEMPSKIPAVTKVWHGKLRSPLTLATFGDAETRKKVMGADGAVTDGKVGGLIRQHGVCMEMTDEGALKAYVAHPYHAEWMKAYEKVRKAGTTTYDIIGQ